MKHFSKISGAVFITLIFIIISGCEKSDNDSLNGKTTAVFNPAKTYGTMTDQQGNVYKTITIGTQTWMAENLRTTIYNDGFAIPNITDDSEWDALKTGAYCNYNNTNDAEFIATNGRLYNWYAVILGRIAPEGWHVPIKEEFYTLRTYLGGVDVAGGLVKELGFTHWQDPNTGGTNESGFTAIPSGHRMVQPNAIFSGLGTSTFFWTTSVNGQTSALTGLISYDEASFNIYIMNKAGGFAVRLVKD